ncbi:50S ribosomal protein L3 [Egibacter rhizosphaerae]|uniref:Large ribosomal subunit protein uL3 n=1 Tax=Egibacter rhizosphaerae TaxID=1670831 RepID=A0A411YGW5_9ACTN|nr:50S ribosomal protein L3 [Egibacter rhizosphaerae]QBI20453.1 50S ribosomal protein L3 [Egibacter rhizosphaerae]
MVARGILGTKVGMTQVFDDDAHVIPVTVVRAGPCPVVQVRTPERDGYHAVQLGYGTDDNPTKPVAGHFAAAGVEPTEHLVELPLEGEYQPGDVVTVAQFVDGQHVDVAGTSKGKGFAGVMKRHGFGGQRASHGAHKTHRAPGAIGGAATPSRVFPGKRMAGRMGAERVTVQSLELVRVDPERNLLLIRGSVPGPNGGLLDIRDAAKRPSPAGAEGGDE